MDGVVVDGTVDGFARPEGLQVLDHPVCVKGGGMVIVEGLPLLQGEIVVGGIIIVVGKYADVIAKLLQQAVHQGGFPGAGAAGNANDEGFHGFTSK